MSRLVLASIVVAALAFRPGVAQTDPRVDELRSRIAALEKTVAEMKSQGSADPARIGELERQIEVLSKEVESLRIGEAAQGGTPQSKHGLGPAASKVYGVTKGVSLGGYGEMVFLAPASSREDGLPSGQSRQLDFLRGVLYFGYKFDDRILFNSELEVEHATTGEGDEERGEISLEFAYLDFLFRQAINVRAGLLLVPMGFINEQHEPPTFLGVRRPLVERGLIPATWRENGVGVFGEAGIVSYRAYLVNSLASVAGTSSGAEGFGPTGIRDGRQGGSQAAAEDFALTARLDVRPIPSLLLGTSVFTGDTSQGQLSAGAPFDGTTTVWDLHAELRFRALQARALWIQTTIDDVEAINVAQGLTGADSVGERQNGGYLEVGYDVLSHFGGGKQSLIPFVRAEQFDTQERVPAGFAANPENDGDVLTIGFNYQPIRQVVIKADWQQVRNEAKTGVDQWNLGLGYLF